jgi:hypothetical protein
VVFNSVLAVRDPWMHISFGNFWEGHSADRNTFVSGGRTICSGCLLLLFESLHLRNAAAVDPFGGEGRRISIQMTGCVVENVSALYG